MKAVASTQAATAPGARRVLLPPLLRAEMPPLGHSVQRLGGAAMGTTWQVLVVTPAGVDVSVLQRGVTRVLSRLVAQMSPWEADSDLCRYQRAAPGRWLRLPAEMAAVMRGALEVAMLSDGAFDPTLGAAIQSWGFGPAPGAAPAPGPTPASQPGWRQLRLEDGDRLLQPGGVQLNLSAIAKGYAVDAVADYLRACGLDHHLVEIGGELCGSGLKPDGQPWWVALEAPDPACTLPQTLLALHGQCVATSGDYRRHRPLVENTLRQAHTLDPRTQAPLQAAPASVSVLHERCMLADAWATACTVLPWAQALAVAQAHRLALRRVDRPGPTQPDWTEHTSPAWRTWLND